MRLARQRDEQVLSTYELKIMTKSGEERWVSFTAGHVEFGGKPAMLGTAFDISERKHHEAQLAHAASHDALTNLFGRRRIQEELERELARAQRNGTHGALLFLDIDQFKDVNDSLGHQAGDELLVQLAGLLRESLRETDSISRLGGDEFAILLPDSRLDQAFAVAEKLLQAIRDYPFVVRGQRVSVTGSLGVALFPEHGTTSEDLLSWADLAMYEAKAAGRNCVRQCSMDGAWRRASQSRLALQTSIQEAFENNRFILHAQPIMDLSRNKISQHELLLRMIGEDGGIVPPLSFLDVAERSGSLQDIERWVVRRAIQLIAKHRREGRDPCLEVNLSGRSFADPQLLPMIRQQLRESKVNPASLIIEITETSAIANISKAQEFVRDLQALGCRFALDDFGIGFSSFYLLKHLPVDFLKIDGIFIADLPRSAVDRSLVKAIVVAARGLGIKTIAEHVGDEETIQLLRQYGVNYAQGNHIGRPGEASEVLSGVVDGAVRAA